MVYFTPGEPAKIELPSKNTFVHFDDSDEEVPLRTESTCPAIVQLNIFRTMSYEFRDEQKKLEQIELHQRGECRPCAYFAFKKDGCRMGDECEYCHLCDRSDIRRWKRIRAKALRAEGVNVLESEMTTRLARASGA
eukprot:TRINITY_DN2411_c0_g1_i1.p1 TRINITY_DN2411_c0_g1~~TRINITY_DN2411_c0_g1_i1.p1  ORF type:complete len:136 (-),score=37.65 TRINITY_DN2411_c0_g1_i1:765-1172(-)